MRVNFKVTVVAGTPVNVATQGTSGDGIPKLATRVLIQLMPASTGVGYIMDGIYGVANGSPRVPNHTASTDLTAIISGAAATTPGATYSDVDFQKGIDISKMWVDGSVSGDTITVSYDLRV